MIRIIDPADSFIVGTIGDPGEREFFIQIRYLGNFHSFAIEKSQVIALSERISLMIRNLKNVTYNFESDLVTELELPITTEFIIGLIGISWHEISEQIVLDIHEFTDSTADNENLAAVRVHLSPTIANNFLTISKKVISAGRLPCPFCDLPINKGGHLCPRANGYRR